MLSEQQWLCENICLCTLEYSDSNKKHHLGESRSIKINCVFARVVHTYGNCPGQYATLYFSARVVGDIPQLYSEDTWYYQTSN